MEHYPSPCMMASISFERKALHIASSSRIAGNRFGRFVMTRVLEGASRDADGAEARPRERGRLALPPLASGDFAHLTRASVALRPWALARQCHLTRTLSRPLANASNALSSSLNAAFSSAKM
jgi:hypothetical protein